VYFYELHESDNDLYSDALLAHEQEFTADEFFEYVQEARRRVLDRFEEDTLVEAVAHELERTLDFTYISDGLLIAAVNVSRIEDENYIAEIDESAEDDERDARDELDGLDDGQAFRSAIVDLDRDRQN
jgi:hypothetical protein